MQTIRNHIQSDKKTGPNFRCASFLKLSFKLIENSDVILYYILNIMPKHDVDQPILVYSRDDHHLASCIS